MAPIYDAYQASPEWQEITLKAYPPPVVQKKQKKVKDRGTRRPGAAQEQQPQQELPERPKEQSTEQ